MRLLQTSALCLVALASACAGLSVYQPTTGDDSGAVSSGDVAADIVRYTNDARTKNGRSPLSSNPRLMEAARIHAEQMASHQSMEHTISGARYPTMQSRLEAVGYTYSNAAENISWNDVNARDAVNGWMNSTGHRANILDARLTEMGAAVARSAKGETYWIQVFGRPR
jgi:uncharacterized protein YkwD